MLYRDNRTFFNVNALRSHARRGVARASLVTRAALGDNAAATVLHIGFWPFVREFELAIDRHKLPWRRLSQQFAPNTIREYINYAASALKQMREEEGSHAECWQKAAKELGVFYLDSVTLPKVSVLLERINDQRLPNFFSNLVATELVAEELSRRLLQSVEFLSLFKDKKWQWGEVHMQHNHEISHLDLDLDLARAFGCEPLDITKSVLETIDLFSEAALEVEVTLLPVPDSGGAYADAL